MASHPRLTSLDWLRGAVMVLMALDHVRVYSGVPAGGPDPGVFVTRWVTHFCAPVFVFLAGTSAFLHGRRLGAARPLATYLVTRGLVLVVLELTVIRAAWTFGVDYSTLVLAGVIWMLGWCMVLLAGLIALPARVVGVLGLVVIVGQDAFGLAGRALPEAWRPVWELVYPVGADVRLGQHGPSIAVLYTLVPWIGVMAAGYGFGTIVIREPAERRRLCLRLGMAATALFVGLASIVVWLGAGPEPAPPVWFLLLNQRKYPASVLFLLMTLGPSLVLLAVTDTARGRLAGVLTTFGRVPMFYYLLHIPVIHAASLVVWYLRDGRVDAARFASAPFVSIPASERWDLALLYVVFVAVVAALYVPCRWFARVKASEPNGWLRYL